MSVIQVCIFIYLVLVHCQFMLDSVLRWQFHNEVMTILLLLNLPDADSASVSHDEKDEDDEIPKGDVFKSVETTFKKIQGLFSVIWDDFKGSAFASRRKFAKDEIGAMNAIIAKLNNKSIIEPRGLKSARGLAHSKRFAK